MNGDDEAVAEGERSSATEDLTSRFTEGFAASARALFSAGSVTDTLQRLVELAVETIEGCDFAGVFVVDGDVVTTPAHTDPVVIDVDSLQHRHGQGPCLDAIADGAVLYADDLSDDPRWPLFGPEATSLGIRSVLALNLSSDGAHGVLNLYARYPKAFGVFDRGRGLLLAGLAAQALAAARAHDDETRRLDNLQGALLTRLVIGQAQGILIERERLTPDQAFDVLRRSSQHLNIKLREVAQSLVDTGESPETGSPRRAT